MRTYQYGWLRCWGTKFKWTPEHLTPKDLEPLIHQYDIVATDALEQLDRISPPPHSFTPHQVSIEDDEETMKPDSEKKAHRDLYGLVGEYASKNEKIGRLWAEVNMVPDWVDWDQIERGQKVFYRYGGAIITTVSACFFKISPREKKRKREKPEE